MTFSYLEWMLNRALEAAGRRTKSNKPLSSRNWTNCGDLGIKLSWVDGLAKKAAAMAVST